MLSIMDGRLGVYATCIFCAVAAASVSFSEGVESNECQQLERAILKFAQTCKGRNYLLSVMGLRAEVNRRSLSKLGAGMGVDLHSPKAVRQLTNKLCHTSSRAFLSYSLRVDILQVDTFFNDYVLPVKTYGRLKSFKTVAKVAVELLEWVLRTGYPVAPLKHAGRWETQTFLEHIQTELTSDPRVRIALREELFPLAYEPSFASAALTEARSLAELSAMLEIPEVWLRSFAREMTPRRIARYIRGVRATWRLYRVANKLGLLDLE